MTYGCEKIGWTNLRGNVEGGIRGLLQDTETASVLPIAPWIFPPTKHSRFPLSIYSNTPGVTPLLVNFKSMIAKPKADGGSKDGISWRLKKVLESCLIRDVVKPIRELRHKTECFQAPGGITGEEMEKVIPDKAKSGTFVPTMAFARMLF